MADRRADDIADFIAGYTVNNFMTLAKYLQKIQEQYPELFVGVADRLGIKRRRAYALARIAKIFGELKTPTERLNKIGWTKLQIISRGITPFNAEDRLALAECCTVHELEKLLQGEIPIEEPKVLVFYLSIHDYEKARSVLLKYGAMVRGKGFVGKEEALMKLIADAEAVL